MKNNQLDAMIGRSFVYKKDNQVYQFLAFKEKAEEVTIVTDREWFVKHRSEVMLFLEWFIPLDNENSVTVVNENKQHIVELENILMDNIKKLQSDKTYLPVAAEVNNQIKSMIELAKVKVEMVKIIRGK